MAADLPFGPAPDGWRVATLGELCRASGGGIQTGPFGSQLHARDYVPIGIPSVMPQSIGDNRIDDAGIARIDEADAVRLERYRLRVGDIVSSRRGDVTRRALVREREHGWLCGTGCLRVRLRSGDLLPPYLSFYLGHPDVKEWLVAHTVGTTLPNLNTSILSALPVAVPPLPEQRAIASVLGALDDKIELNRKMNRTLEGLASALFRSWFVDFDPVVAKAEGRKPFGMSKETAALFPDRFVDSPLGPIPAGWHLSTIGEEVRVVGGSTPPTGEASFWDGTIFWATPRDMSTLEAPVVVTTARRITEAGLARIGSGLLPVGTVLLSSRAPIGYLAIAAVPLAVNQGFIAMVCDRDIPNHFVRCWTAQNMDEIESRAGGTTFAEISKENFRPIPVVVPPIALFGHFEAVAAPLHERVVANVRENVTLAALRDTLLPPLMSGELRIRDVEKQVEAAL